jgi:hypothetical protein
MSQLDPTILRRYSDGELGAEESRRVESLLPGDLEAQRTVEFERRLRRRIALVMGEPSAPDGLRERLRLAIDAEEAVDSSVPSRGPFRIFAAPRAANVWAVAASLALVVGVVLYGVFGPQIDELGASPRPSADLVAEAARHVTEQHHRCAGDYEEMLARIEHRSPAEAALAISERLGVDRVTVFELSEFGYEFMGDGSGDMPSSDPSAHLIYRRVDDERPAVVSIFIVANRSGKLGCWREGRRQPGKWHCCDGRVLRAVDESLVYFLVCCRSDDRERVAQLIADSLAAAR